jgi:hypothetical protein
LVEPISTDPYRQSTGGSEVEQRLKNGAVPSGPEVNDLLATGRAHLGPEEPDDEKPSKVQ